MTGQWDGDDFVRYVRKGLHNPTTEEITDEDILSFVHRAEVDLCSVHQFPQLLDSEVITTNAAQTDPEKYELSSADVMRLHVVTGESDGTPERLQREDYDTIKRLAGSDGAQAHLWWPVDDATVGLYPTPTETGVEYRVWFWRFPVAPLMEVEGTTPATVSELGHAWDMVVAMRALQLLAPMVGRSKDAGDHARAAGVLEARARKTLPRPSERIWKMGSRISRAVNVGR